MFLTGQMLVWPANPAGPLWGQHPTCVLRQGGLDGPVVNVSSVLGRVLMTLSVGFVGW